jgi:hypothetical protein
MPGNIAQDHGMISQECPLGSRLSSPSLEYHYVALKYDAQDA